MSSPCWRSVPQEMYLALGDGYGLSIISVGWHWNIKAADEARRRIVASWNAFENVPTEKIESMIGTGAMEAAADAVRRLPVLEAELTAARALLREIMGDCVLSPYMEQRVQSYLDTCDTLGTKDAEVQG